MARILIVDDEKSIRRTLGEFLRAEGHEVLEAEEAEIAQRYLAGAEFDVVVTDIILPRVSGVELLQRIHAAAPHVQVVMMTGEPTVETATESLRAGAVDYLFKPIDKAAIVRAVANAAWIKRLEDTRRRLEEENRVHREELERLVEERTAQLSASEERYRTLVEAARDTIFTLSPDGIFTSINSQFTATFGWGQEEWLGRSYEELVHPDDIPLARSVLARVLRMETVPTFELRVLTKTGEWIPTEYNVASRTEEGRFCELLGVARDVTERKQAEAALRQSNLELEQRVAERTQELSIAKDKADAANRAKSIFLANISHEIRTPMNAVLGFTQLLLSHSGTNPDQREYLSHILRSGEHLLKIINEILEMARIDAGRSVLTPEVFDLPGFLCDLESIFCLSAQEQAIDFTIEPAPGLPRHLTADATKLRQVFINLLSNAFKFTPAGGRVTLRVRASPQTAGQVLLKAEVEDTGTGLQPDEAARVFEPFFQTESGRVAGGTGLGLSISRAFARAMGGDLTVRSKPGSGSKFELAVSLPLTETGEIPDERPRQSVGRLSSAWVGYRVLVVDDSPDSCEVLKLLLTALDFSVRTAPNGLEALRQAQDWTPGLVILDLRMPVMDGYEASRRLRETHGQTLKILILSASATEGARQQAVEAGAEAFMQKPFWQDELLECIQNLTGVEYLASETHPDASSKREPERKELPLAHGIPAEWFGTFRKALFSADYHGMLELVHEISSLDEPLRRQLRQLIERFDYSALEELLKRMDARAQPLSQRPQDDAGRLK